MQTLIPALGGIQSKPGGGDNEEQGRETGLGEPTIAGLPVAALGVSAYLFRVHFITETLGGNRLWSFFISQCTEHTREPWYLARKQLSSLPGLLWRF